MNEGPLPYARKGVARYVAQPCDEEIDDRPVRTWGVFDRLRGVTYASGFKTRREARDYATAASRNILHFVDPETGEAFRDDEKHDVHGVDLIGVDDDHFWWGTERAACVLSDHWSLVRVTAYMHGSSIPCDYFFIGTESEARAYVESRAVVHHIESGDPGELSFEG